jgi:hypothetical protein
MVVRWVKIKLKTGTWFVGIQNAGTAFLFPQTPLWSGRDKNLGVSVATGRIK